MDQSLEDAGFVNCEKQGWACCDLSTKKSAFLAFASQESPRRLLGVEGKADTVLVDAILAAIDNVDIQARTEETFVVPIGVDRFDSLGFVRGSERRLLRGIIDDESALQVIPLYTCELAPDGQLPPLADLRRWTNLFALDREPQPYYQFRMNGHPSRLKAEMWCMERFATFQSFLHVLAGDESAWIEVRNRHDQVLALSGKEQLTGALEKIRTHVGL